MHSTASTPTSTRVSALMITPPTSQFSLGYARGTLSASTPQMTCAIEFNARNNPIVTMTITSGDDRSTGRITTRSMSAPPMNDRTTDSRIASQTGTPLSVNHHVRYVLTSAISPCAKLRIPVVL